jgi:hypothetical protein
MVEETKERGIEEDCAAMDHRLYLFDDKYPFSILPKQQRARSDFCLIFYVVNYGRVGKYIMRKSKRYPSPPLPPSTTPSSLKAARWRSAGDASSDHTLRSPLYHFFFFFCNHPPPTPSKAQQKKNKK